MYSPGRERLAILHSLKAIKTAPDPLAPKFNLLLPPPKTVLGVNPKAIDPVIENRLLSKGGRLINPDKTILGNLPHVFGMQKPPELDLDYQPDTLSEEFLRHQRELVLKNSRSICYLAALRPSLFDLFYPRVLEGYYIPPFGTSKRPSTFSRDDFGEEKLEGSGLLIAKRKKEILPLSPATSPETTHLLKYFGCENAEELFETTVEYIRKKFNSSPQYGQNIITALEFMRKVHDNKLRQSGEPAITHELRILLRVMAGVEYLSYDHAPAEYSQSFYAELLSAIFTSVVLHDFIEDYVKKDKAYMYKSGNNLYLTTQNQETSEIRFSDGFYADLVVDMLSAYTNYDFDPENRSEAEAANENTYKLLLGYQRYTPLIAWAIAFGKCCDREDNLEHLETYDVRRYYRKLIETYYAYQFPSIISWVPNRADVPMGMSTAVLKLMGADNDELFGWVANNKDFNQFIKGLKSQGLDPIVVPSIYRVAILINSQRALFGVVSRNTNG